MSLAAFTPRVLSGAVRDLGDSRVNFLLNSVFTLRKTHHGNTIDLAKLTSRARVLPFVRQDEPALPVNKMAGSLLSLTAPRIRVKKTLDENFFATLNPGLTSYAGPYTDPNAQIGEKLAEEQDDLRRSIDKTIEMMAAEGLATGTITIAYEDGSSVTLDLGYTGDGATAGDTLTIQPTLSGTSAWTSAQSEKLDVLEDLARQIRENSDWDGTIDILMGYKACRNFVKDAKVQKLLDLKAVNAGSLTLTERAAYKGTVNGFNIWQYVGGYINSSNARVNVWDPHKIAAVPSGSDNFSVEFGAVFEREAPDAQEKFIQTEYFSKLDRKSDPVTTDLIVESHPAPIVRNPAKVRVLTTGADAA